MMAGRPETRRLKITELYFSIYICIYLEYNTFVNKNGFELVVVAETRKSEYGTLKGEPDTSAFIYSVIEFAGCIKKIIKKIICSTRLIGEG